MRKSCNGNIKKAFDLARQLTILADEGEGRSEDDGCALLYSVVRDCAYKIKAQAERERHAHIQRGAWEDETGD